jgi:hypothetical protein
MIVSGYNAALFCKYEFKWGLWRGNSGYGHFLYKEASKRETNMSFHNKLFVGMIKRHLISGAIHAADGNNEERVRYCSTCMIYLALSQS